MSDDNASDTGDEMNAPAATTRARDPDCYIDQYPHSLPHRGTTIMRPCGHLACDPHVITYYGSGDPNDAREGDYCLVCFERTFPGRCPDRSLRAALAT